MEINNLEPIYCIYYQANNICCDSALTMIEAEHPLHPIIET